jgi:phosphoribosylaminoimidazole-succinocarboxamide synthase
MFNVKKIPLMYAGSVKNLRAKVKPTAKKTGVLVFEFTDDYSVFDYGKMPDTIPGKGEAMAMGSAFIFESIESPAAWKRLAKSKVWSKIKTKSVREGLQQGEVFKKLKKTGLKTHYRGLIDPESGRTLKLKDLKKPSHLLEVAAMRIIHPKPMMFGDRKIYNYNHLGTNDRNFLIPLECIFRFGVPEGSSLLERVKRPGYLEALGLKTAPKAGAWLSRPVVEYFSKLEPSDRLLDHELALNMSGLSNEKFAELYDITLLIALFLAELFGKAGLNLWDGKFEYLMAGNQVAIGDAITPDELRLTYKGIQISKEPLRQYYKKYDKKFVKAMEEAKVLAKKSDKSLAAIVNEDLKVPPAKLDADFKAAVADMYTGLAAQISGNKLLGDSGKLPAVLKAFKKFGIA